MCQEREESVTRGEISRRGRGPEPKLLSWPSVPHPAGGSTMACLLLIPHPPADCSKGMQAGQRVSQFTGWDIDAQHNREGGWPPSCCVTVLFPSVPKAPISQHSVLPTGIQFLLDTKPCLKL